MIEVSTDPAVHTLRAGERAVFVGTPGSGKTTLVQWFLDSLRSVVVIDSKLDPREWASWGPRHGYAVSKDPASISQHRHLIFQIDQRALDDREGWEKPGRIGYQWSEALGRLLTRGSTVVVFDEVLQTLPAGQAHPQARRIFTQGRSLGLSTWGGTQLANRVDTMVFRLAEHCFAFAIRGQDAKLLASSRDIDCGQLTALEPFHFAYHRASAPEWRICSPVEAS